jgi:hypothetical protein
MIRAVKGMIKEKEMIFGVFVASIFVFQVMTLTSTWVVMKTYASAICSIILVIGGCFWYQYCMRIYTRFRFIEPDVEWREDRDTEDSNPPNRENNKYEEITPARGKKSYGKRSFFPISR